MSASVYLGAGTTLSSSYYVRRFYSENENARTTTKRKQLSNSTLSNADAHALRQAVKSLGSFSYDDVNSTNIRNNVKAFVSTYNNLMSSAADSQDRKTIQNAKNIKNLTNEYADDLDKLGITVNADGTLEARTALLNTTSISKFEKLFSSDTDYMQRVNSFAKRIEQRGSTLYLEEQHALRLKSESAANAAANTKETVGVDLNSLLNNGIGSNINISL